MAAQKKETPVEKFTAYNPYAAELEGIDLEPQTTALLAIAYELKQLNGAVRFGNQGRSQ
jgi:hypothetical protein